MRFILGLALLIAAAACADDTGFGGKQQRPPGDNDVEQNPPMLIQPGDTFAYMFFKTYDPDPISSATAHEKSVIGYACIKVVGVTDNWASSTESTIQTQVQLAGPAGADIFFRDQDEDPGATSEDVDAFMAPLWLDGLMPPTRGHGLASPTAVAFSTRQSAVPPDQRIHKLPFFDARPASDTATWNGWGGYLVDLFAWAQAEFGNDYALSSETEFDFDTKSALGCEAGTSAANCPPGECLWDFQTNECVGQLSVSLAWRETIAAPVELAAGPVIHYVKLGFTVDGALRNYDEVIRPDTSGGVKVNINQSQFTTCAPGDHTPCAKAGFSSMTWAEADECNF
jgi:hypothetical protein